MENDDIPLLQKINFLTHTWAAKDVAYSCYTHIEIRRIHKTLCNPSASAMEGLLSRADNDGIIGGDTKESISRVREDLMVCRRDDAAPWRFKISIGTDDLRFNSCGKLDTMFIGGKPVVHMVDEPRTTRPHPFSETSILVKFGIIYEIYGPPDYLVVDQGSAYVSAEMKATFEADGVKMRQAPIENPGTIGVVERYYAPLRRALNCVREEMGNEVGDLEFLRMSVF